MSDRTSEPDGAAGERRGAAEDGCSGPLPRLFAQFGRPTGLLGHLAGWLMSRIDADDRWIVELLDVQPHDRVLDVGCGPGVTVALSAARARLGFVAGVDPSDVMVRQATRRNRAAIREGRVELRLGTVSALPYPDGRFTKACALHTLQFWPSVEAGLREVRRVLAPGGLLVLALHMWRPEAGRFDPSRYGFTEEQVAEIMATLGAIGFLDVTTRRREFDRESITAILARR
jgi:ubiquinone/menaquinone biosynthesis C-methylase UbiE